MSSTSASNGNASVTLTFQSGTNPDIAQVQVQNKLQAALPLLPQIVQQQGVRVNKANPGFLMVLGFVSEDGSMDRVDIADYLNTTHLGAGQPARRASAACRSSARGTRCASGSTRTSSTPTSSPPRDVIAAIRAQNAQVAVGQLGGTPAVPGQQINATVTAQGRLETPEQFRAIVVRSQPDGSTVKLGDVARVEIGAESYDVIGRYNGQPATGIAINLATNANALETAKRVEQLVKRLEPSFPPGLKAVIPFDTTPFVNASIKEVVKTLHRGRRAGVPGDVPLPAELPRHADPHHRRAGGAARHLRRALGARLLDQHAHHVRDGARHRPAGGRRHRGGGERRAR